MTSRDDERWLRARARRTWPGWLAWGIAWRLWRLWGADSFTVTQWQTDRGLPHNSVTAVAQAGDGYVWVATRGGLARFNGAAFTPFGPGQVPGLPRQFSLLVPWTGEVLLARGPHEQWWRISGGTTFARDPALDGVEAVQIDRAGQAWGVRERRLFHVTTAALVPVALPGGAALYDDFKLVAAGEAHVLVGGRWFRWRDARWMEGPRYAEPEGVTPEYRVMRRDGTLWVFSRTERRILPPDGPARPAEAVPYDLRLPWFRYEDAAGRDWFAFDDRGLVHVSPSGAWRRVLSPDQVGAVNALAEDREGGLWVATDAHGLFRLARAAHEVLEGAVAGTGGAVQSLCAARDGGLWLAKATGLWRLREGAFERWLPPGAIPEAAPLQAVLEDRLGRVWVTTSGFGVFEVQGRSASLVAGEGLSGGVEAVSGALFEARDGAVWIGTSQGAARHLRGRYHFLGTAAGLPPGMVNAFGESSTGHVWIGTAGGLAKWEPSGAMTRATGLPAGSIQALAVTPDDAVWLAVGESGFGRWHDGRFAPAPLPPAEASWAVSALADDGRGGLWVLSDRGVFHAPWQELGSAGVGGQSAGSLWRRAVRADEIAAPVPGRVRTPGVAHTAEGRLWFPTLRGIVGLAPGLDLRNPLAPPVRIEEVRVDGMSVAVPSSGEVTVAPGRRRVEVRYAGLSYQGPVRYQRRLEPFDRDWIDAGPERAAVFDGLAPGRYRLRVRAANSDGAWNDRGAELALHLAPAWWQTTWFRLLWGATLLALLGTTVGWASTRRLRRALARLEQQRALERERARLARDLHDDVGASLTVLAVQAELARRELPAENHAAAERFDRIAAAARDTAQRLDEVVWTVNPGNDALDRFADYLCHTVERTLDGSGVRLRWEAPASLPPLAMAAETRHALLLVVKEALQNVLKHAGASEVRVGLQLDEGCLAIGVEDDGRGFDPAVATRSDADGVGNLRHRALAVGATFELVSAPGRGTRVRVAVALQGRHSPGGEKVPSGNGIERRAKSR